MDKATRDEIRTRCKYTTPGPWLVADDPDTYAWMIEDMDHDDGYVAFTDDVNLLADLTEERDRRGGPYVVTRGRLADLYGDAEFIAHAREDIPALLDHIDHLEAENEQLRSGA